MGKINVTRSSMPPFEEYVEALKPVWESRWLSNRGEASLQFEQDLKQYLGCDNIWLFANGHLALEVALLAFDFRNKFPEGVKPEIITTAYTHVSTTEAIVRNQLEPVFVDVEPHFLTMDPTKIEAKITERTVAIVATHVYGFMCDVEAIQKIADQYHLKVIYDAAHAFGVTYKGNSPAVYGDAVMFSTHATKVFHTIEGGILTYKENEKLNHIEDLVNFGYVSQEDVAYIGLNARMNEFEAVMGICNLRHFDGEIEKRRKIVELYNQRLDGTDGIRILKPSSDIEWNYAYYPVLFEGYKEDRNQIQKKLEKEDIYARKYFYPITTQVTAFKKQYGSIDLPISLHASSCVLSLPLYPDLSFEDVNRICDIILR